METKQSLNNNKYQPPKSEFNWQAADTCEYCGGTEFELFLNSFEPNWYGGQPINLHRCTNCQLIMASHMPDPQVIYKKYLVGEATARAAVERKLNRPNVLNVHKKAVATATEFHQGTPKTLFDMGCGAGTILEAAKEAGLEAQGNDINLAAIERLREIGFTAHHGFTKDLGLPKNKFDIVINFDYLEHSYSPFNDLKVCNEIMTDDGILYLKTLYMDCPDHIIKADKYQLFGSGHFHYFSARTVCSMVHDAGFDIINLKLGGLIFVVAQKKRAPQAYSGHYDFNVINRSAE